MIAEYTIGKTALSVYALICAWQDIRTMSIGRRTVTAGFFMAVLGVVLVSYITILSGNGVSSGTENDRMAGIRYAVPVIAGAALGCLPGMAILAVSRLTGQIGAGDGLYLIITGAALGLRDTCALLLLAVFLNALVSCGILIWTRTAVGKACAAKVLRKKMPFIPAACAALIWMLMR